jgi:hypothetical protein
LCWLAAAPGKPPSADETRLFDDGMRAFQAGKPRDADQAWRAGYALAKDPAFLVRMGEAEEKAGQPAEAAESYRHYLRAVPDAADRAEIAQRLARLTPAGETAATPRTGPGVSTAAGTAEIPGSLGAGGAPPVGAAETGVSAAAGAGAPATAPAPATIPARDDELARRANGDPEDRGWTQFNVTAWIATGATVLLLGTAGYFAAAAGSAKDDVNLLSRYQDPMTGAPLEYHSVADRYERSTRDGQHDDRVAKGALIAAAGAALVATVFFIVDAVRAPDEHQARREGSRATRGARLGLQIAPTPAGSGGAHGPGAAALSSLRWSF